MCARCGVGKSCDNSFPSAVIAKEITWAQRLEFFGRNFDKPAAGFPSIGAPKEGVGAAARQPPPTKHNLLTQISESMISKVLRDLRFSLNQPLKSVVD